MLFCNQDGEMREERSLDLVELGEILKNKGLNIHPDVNENMANFLKCFGDIDWDEEKELIQVKEEEKKAKEAPKKIGDNKE